MNEAKKRKLTAPLVKALRAATKHSIVPGGMDATFKAVYKLADAGLVEPNAYSSYNITDKGTQALKDGFYMAENMDAEELIKATTRKKIKKFNGLGFATGPRDGTGNGPRDGRGGRCQGRTAEELIDELLKGYSSFELIEALAGTANRPRKRRFGRRGAAFDPRTGKRKDPKRRRMARMAARRHKAKRKAASRKFHRSAKGKSFHKKLGKLVARIRR